MTDWRDIESAPDEGSFIVAAWTGDAWVVGEAERDPDEPELIWWINERGEYHADTLQARGFTHLRWQPMPKPPTEPPA